MVLDKAMIVYLISFILLVVKQLFGFTFGEDEAGVVNQGSDLILGLVSLIGIIHRGTKNKEGA